MKEKKLRLALLGKDVSKSQSDKIHRFILKNMGYGVEYERVSIPPSELDFTALRLLGDFDGFNVTIPYKRDIMEYLDGVKGDAFAFGAVNTVVSASRLGYNTDGKGFLALLRFAGIEVKGKTCLIIGAGGAGRSTAVTLKNAGAIVSLYRRTKKELEETCKELGVTAAKKLTGYQIIINASGVGMHDTEGLSPVGEESFWGAEVAIDLIYRPAESAFLRLAKERGIKTVNGASLLFFQAYYSDCLYLEKEP
jgi:shikimate dehydrogenase